MPTGIYAVVKSFVYSGAQYFMFMDVDTSAAGMDFNTTSAVLIFNASISHQCESLTILNDTILENNETFFVQMESIDPAVNITLDSASVTILDDDSEYEINFTSDMSFISILPSYFLSAVVTVRLQQPQTSIGEQDGAVMVCAVLCGETERILQVILSTQTNIAVG